MGDNVKAPVPGMNFLHASGTISIPTLHDVHVGDVVHFGIIPKYLKDVVYKPVIISCESNGEYYTVLGRIIIDGTTMKIAYEDGGTVYAFVANDPYFDEWEYTIPE